jgi:hypothetical protein
VELDFQRKDGSTLRANLKQAERSKKRKLIVEPKVPGAAAHLWGWFWQLSNARPEGFSSAGPLTFGEIAAWAGLTGARPQAWEVEALKAMDRAYLASVAKIST